MILCITEYAVPSIMHVFWKIVLSAPPDILCLTSHCIYHPFSLADPA